MVALGEDPAVAARDDAELEHGAPAIVVRPEAVVVYVAFYGNSDRLVPAELERPAADPVDAVRADERRGVQPLAARRHLDTFGARLGVLHLHAVAHLGTRVRGLLQEVGVEPEPLGHQHQRLPVAALDPAAEAQPHPHGRDHVFDHGVDREREQARSAPGDAAAARLVAREPRAVEHEHGGAGRGEPVRARRAGRAGADDDRVVARHRAIIACARDLT